MYRLAIAFSIACSASGALAQGCFETDLGKSLGNAQDTIFPIEPIGFAFPLNTGNYANIHVSDHGLVWLSNGGFPPPPNAIPLVFTPDPVQLMQYGPVIAPLWVDCICGTNGQVLIKSTPTQCTVTWKDVHVFGFPAAPFTTQLTLYPNGNVSFRYSPNATNNSTYGGTSVAGVVGISRGAPPPPALPPEVDVSAAPSTAGTTVYEFFQVANTFDLSDNGIDIVPTFPGYSIMPALGAPSGCAGSESYGVGCGGLGLVTDRPVIGGAWTLTTTGIDPASPISVTFLAVDPLVPGVSLLAALGLNAPGCEINLATPPLLGDVMGPNNGGVSSVTLPIPPMAGLAGATLAAQSLCLTFGNPAGVYLSNGNLATLDLN